MIYLGVLGNHAPTKCSIEKLQSVIDRYADKSKYLNNGNIMLCYAKENPINDFDELLHNQNFIVLGRLFDRQTYEPYHQDKFSLTAIENIGDFNAKFWGKYVVIQNDLKKQTIYITRDLSAQLPVFYFKDSDGLIFISSHIEILAGILKQPLKVNFQAIVSYLHFNRSYATSFFEKIFEVMTEKTLAINGNNQIAVLEAKQISNSKTTIHSTSSHPISDILINTLKAWIKPYNNIYLSYSGGLDSTALLYCLKDSISSSQNLFAVNFYHPDFNESCERGYAEKGAAENNIPLLKVSLAECLPFSNRINRLSLLPNKPCMAMLGMAMQEAAFHKMDPKVSSLMITGQGGDHVFLCPPSMLSIVDCLVERQFSIIPKKLRELAYYYRVPLFEIIQKNMKAIASTFNHTKLMDKYYLQKFSKPWFKGIDSVIEQDMIKSYSDRFLEISSLGKKEHFHYIFEGLYTIEQVWIDPSNPCFYPFLSQPLLDYVTKLKTFNLYANGYDRYLIRNEISKRYNTDLVWRRDKGGTTGATLHGFKRNLDAIKAWCLEGYFATHNLIDKNQVLDCIIASAKGNHEHMLGLIHLIVTEMFIESWQTKGLTLKAYG